MIYEYNSIISFHVGLVVSWKGSYERRIWQHVIETRKLSTRKCVQKDKMFVETFIYHCQIIWECMYCLRLQLSLQDFSPRSQRNSSCQHCSQTVLHFSQNPNTSLSWLQNHASSVVFLLQSSELQHSVFKDTGSFEAENGHAKQLMNIWMNEWLI